MVMLGDSCCFFDAVVLIRSCDADEVLFTVCVLPDEDVTSPRSGWEFGGFHNGWVLSLKFTPRIVESEVLINE